MSTAPSLPSSSIPIAPRAARPSSFIGTRDQPLPPAPRSKVVAAATKPRPSQQPSSATSSLSSSSSSLLMPFPSERREERDRAGSPTLVLKKNGSIGRAAGANLRQMPRSPLSMVGGEMPKGMGTPVRERTGTGAGGALMMGSEGGGGLSLLPNRSHLSYPSPVPPTSSSSSVHPHPRNPLLSFSTATAAPSPHSTDSSSASTPTSVRLTPSGTGSTRTTPKLVPRSSLYDYEAMRDAASLPEDQSLLIEDLEGGDGEGWDRNSVMDTPGGGAGEAFDDAPSLPNNSSHRRSSTSNNYSPPSPSRRRPSSTITATSDVFLPLSTTSSSSPSPTRPHPPFLHPHPHHPPRRCRFTLASGNLLRLPSI
ncbi:hypothetical protein BDY24DRAFT_374492 [Mrakia frigida]|uniref:uncharacterized protein n=1 Tax=Mrakia frigida TaxID=29902 RepID=UPI003FCBFA8B